MPPLTATTSPFPQAGGDAFGTAQVNGEVEVQYDTVIPNSDDDDDNDSVDAAAITAPVVVVALLLLGFVAARKRQGKYARGKKGHDNVDNIELGVVVPNPMVDGAGEFSGAEPMPAGARAGGKGRSFAQLDHIHIQLPHAHSAVPPTHTHSPFHPPPSTTPSRPPHSSQQSPQSATRPWRRWRPGWRRWRAC